jgi:hypothetical protein
LRLRLGSAAKETATQGSYAATSQWPTKSDYRDDDAERAGMRNPIALYMLTMREFKKIPNRSGEQSLKLTTVDSRVEDGSGFGLID